MARATKPNTTPPGDQEFSHAMTCLRAMGRHPPADAEFLAQCDRWTYLYEREHQLYRQNARGYMNMVRAAAPEMAALHAKIVATVPTSTAGQRAKIDVALMELPDAGTMWAMARSALAMAADMAAFEPGPRTPQARLSTAQAGSAHEASDGATSGATSPDAELLAACAAHAEADDRLRALRADRSTLRLRRSHKRVLAREDAIDEARDDVEEALDWLGRLAPRTSAGMAAKAGALRRNFRGLMVDSELEHAADDAALGADDRLLLTFLEQVAGGVA